MASHKRRVAAVIAAATLALTGCAGGSFTGYVEASCAPTDASGVTVCSTTQKPIPTATATVTETVPGPTETVTVPGPTVTVTVTPEPAPTTAAPTPTETTVPTSSPTATPTQTTEPVAPPATCTTAAPANGTSTPPSGDQREYVHGVEVVKHNGQNMVVYARNRTPLPSGDWEHDIFYSYFDACNAAATFAQKSLVSARLAQEPASAAVNTDGRLNITAEDQQYSADLDQTFGIWGPAMEAVKPYGQRLMSPQGGHSGHVAASGRNFGISFSDGWVDGGGVDNLGTGDDVFFRAMDSAGNLMPITNTAVGTSRDWWPIVAGSDTNYLQVWQRYGTAGTGGGTVMGAIIDGTGKVIKAAFPIFTNNKYYYHDVQYIPQTGQFLVTGSQNSTTNAGIAVLVDKAGTVVATKSGLPNTVREGQTVLSDDGKTAVYPGGTGAVVLNLTATGITLQKQVPLTGITWSYMGTDGVFADPTRVVFATGTTTGIKFINVPL